MINIEFHLAFAELNACRWRFQFCAHWSASSTDAMLNLADVDSPCISRGYAIAVLMNISASTARVYLYQRPSLRNELVQRSPPTPRHPAIVLSLGGQPAAAIASAIETELNHLIQVEQLSGIESLC